MLPDILGYDYEQGRQKLLERGFTNILTIHTESPLRNDDKNCNYERIIRAKYVDSSSVEILVCRI